MILAFYSYKGGVGRTSLALDTAARIALGGAQRPPLRVLVWDLDLDAPGIAHFPAVAKMAGRASYGTHDLLALLDPRASSGAGADTSEVGESEVLAVLGDAIASDPEVAEGRLSLLLPFGRRSPAASAPQPDVARLFGPDGSGPELLVLVAELARRELGFDVIVLDARTGINDLAATATTVLADCAVLVFRLDGQDLAHLSEIVNAIHDAWNRAGAGAAELPNRLRYVANLVPGGDEELRGAVAARLEELAEVHLEPHLELALRPLALVRESTPSLEGPPLADQEEYKLEQLATWAYERWADLRKRDGLAAGLSRTVDRSGSATTTGKRLEDEVAALLRLGGWRISGTSGKRDEGIDLRAEKTGEFGRHQALVVVCDASRRGAGAHDVARLRAVAETLAGTAHSEAMLVARRMSKAAKAAARSLDVILVTPEELLDQQAPGAPLRWRAKELWEGTALERHYVVPTAVALDGEGAPTGEQVPLDDYALSWLDRSKTGLLCVLGDFGAGKTTFCRRLGAVLADGERPDAPLPLFVDLRTAGSTALTIDGLLRHALDQAKLDQSRLDPWRYRLQQGSLVLLVDGFDELLGYTDPARMQGLLEELQQAAIAGRVLVTSRSSYFRSDRDAALALRGRHSLSMRSSTALWNQLTSRSEVSVTALEVLPFTDAQIHAYLARRFGADRVEAILARLRALHPVDDLLRRPYLLTLVAASIDQWEARSWPTRLTLTSVYESYVAEWLSRDARKQRGLPAEPAGLAQHLARVLWDRPDAHISSRELRREAAAWGVGVSGRVISPEEEETIEAKVRTALFLVRDEYGAYRFAHRSFLEFFVAKDIADVLAAAPEPDELGTALDLARLTPEIATFLAGWPESWSAVPDACQTILESPPARPRASANALLLSIWHARAHTDGESARERAPVIVLRNARLAGVDLNRADLTAVSLRGADLAGADLDGATLRYADLSAACLANVSAIQADFTRADLSVARMTGACLAGAHLDGAKLELADLSGCDLGGATLRGAKAARCSFTSALLSRADLSRSDATQADLSHARLTGAIANEVDLSEARMQHADLRFVSLRGSTLPAGMPDPGAYGLRLTPPPETLRGAAVGNVNLTKPQALCAVRQGAGSLIAVGGADGAVHMWDPGTGSFWLAHALHSDSVRAVCQPGEESHSMLVSCGDDGMLVSWSLDGVRPAIQHRASDEPITAMCALGCAGELPAVAFGDGSRICIWDPRHAHPHRMLADQETPLTALCAAQLPGGGHALVGAGTDMTICLWDLASGSCRAILVGHTDWVRAMCEVTLADGSPGLASAGDDQTIRVWDLERGRCVAELRGHTDWVYALCAVTLADGSAGLASAGDDEVVRLWSVGAGEQVAALAGHTKWVRGLCVASLDDGPPWLASTGEDETIRIWDLAREEALTAIDGETSEIQSICRVSLGRGATGVAAAGDDGGLRIWEPDRGELMRLLVGTDSILAACGWAFPNGSTGVAVGGNQTVRIWKANDGHASSAVGHHCEWLKALAQVEPAQGRPLIAAAGDDGVIRLLEPQAGERFGELGGREDAILALAQVTLPGGENALVSADSGGNVVAYEIAKQGSARHLGRHGVEATALCFLADERAGTSVLASADRGGTIKLWSLAEGGQIGELEHPGGAVLALCAMRGDDRSSCLVSGGGDGAIRIWHLGREGGGDGAIRIWHPGREGEYETIGAHRGAVVAVCPVRLGEPAAGLVSAGIDGTLRVHRMDARAGLTLMAARASSDWMAYGTDGVLGADSVAAWGTEAALNRLLLVGGRWNAVDARLAFPDAVRVADHPEPTFA